MNACTLAREREAYQQALRESLDRLVALLAAGPTVERVVLFGSYARGRADLQSMDLGSLERMAELSRRPISLPVDADILAYTPQEWERVQETPFRRAVLKDGVVL